jgi:hypothetical protein
MISRTSLDTVIQVVTSVAVLIGLALVVWELRQSREATSSQLTSDGIAHASALSTAVMSGQTAGVLARACDDPTKLTTSD